MPRVTSSSGSHSSFRGAEQSLHIMRQVKSYFNVGMDHVLEVAADMAEYGKGDENQAKQLRHIMLNYLKMDREMDNFMAAANDFMDVGNGCQEQGGLVKMLEHRVKEQSQHSDDQGLQEQDKFLELQQKIWDSQNPDALPTTLRGAAASSSSSTGASLSAGGVVEAGGEGGQEEVEVELTQEQITTRCPYTGREMEDPVRNVVCRHTYDRAGIVQHMKKRGKKAMCPVAGCTNNKPITSRDLEEHKEMKRFIQNKNKRTTQSSAGTSGAGSSTADNPRTS